MALKASLRIVIGDLPADEEGQKSAETKYMHSANFEVTLEYIAADLSNCQRGSSQVPNPEHSQNGGVLSASLTPKNATTVIWF
jgi:hypothetical protein